MRAGTDLRSESDQRAFREARRLLVAFAIAAVPATLLLGAMGGDFLEGDFGLAGTLAMLSAGGASIVAAAAVWQARRGWAAGRPLADVLWVMCWPVLLTLSIVAAGMMLLAMEFAFLLGDR